MEIIKDNSFTNINYQASPIVTNKEDSKDIEIKERSNKDWDKNIQSKASDEEIDYIDTTVETFSDDLMHNKSKPISDYLQIKKRDRKYQHKLRVNNAIYNIKDIKFEEITKQSSLFLNEIYEYDVNTPFIWQFIPNLKLNLVIDNDIHQWILKDEEEDEHNVLQNIFEYYNAHYSDSLKMLMQDIVVANDKQTSEKEIKIIKQILVKKMDIPSDFAKEVESERSIVNQELVI